GDVQRGQLWCWRCRRCCCQWLAVGYQPDLGICNGIRCCGSGVCIGMVVLEADGACCCMNLRAFFKRYRTLVLGFVALGVFVHGAINVFGVDPWVMADIAAACLALVVVMAVL